MPAVVRKSRRVISTTMKTEPVSTDEFDQVCDVDDSISETFSEPEVDHKKEVMCAQILSMEPPTCQINLDVIQITLLFAAFCTRLYEISIPRVVIFDELQYIRYIKLYLNRTFFFDVHPPLAKMLYAGIGHLAGYNISNNFNKIGETYPDTLPILPLRLTPALLGCVTVPVMYQIFVELKTTKWAATLAAVSVLFENALLTQSRVLMAESPLIFILSTTVLSTLKIRNQKPFTFRWWSWLTVLSVCVGVSLSIKYISVMTLLFVLAIIGWDLWQKLSDERNDLGVLLLSAIAQLTSIIVIAVTIYISVFYVHLSLLTRAGHHDNIMTSRFQASLEGGLRSITQGQPPTVAYGSQVTLRHTYGPICWLHSHKAVYPVRYKDGRGSSHQQQVTCYTHKDVNNWWLVKKPEKQELRVDDPIVPVKHGDIIELVHGMTKNKLNSHDVAAPKSPALQEVSGYIDYNVSMVSRTLWRVEVINRETDGDTWTTIRSHVRLVHANSSQIMRTTGKNLPEWGFNQLEVVTDKSHYDSSIWNVEEHKYTKPKDPKDTEPKDHDIMESELIPTQSTTLGFWEKFTELQWKMLTKREKPLDHRFSSLPTQWIHGSGNVAYWLNPGKHTQIHLIGNLAIWLSALLCLGVQMTIMIFFLISRARLVCPYSEQEWDKIRFLFAFSVGGYLLHYLPFHFVEYTYFLYHYMPALLYKLMIVPCTFEMALIMCRRRFTLHVSLFLALTLWIGLAAYNFVTFLPLSYGSELTKSDIDSLRWHPSWDFIVK